MSSPSRRGRLGGRLTRLLPLGTVGAAMALAGVAPAQTQPGVVVDKPCYSSDEQVTMLALGLPPTTPYQAQVDGLYVDSGTTNPGGGVLSKFSAPYQAKGEATKTLTITAGAATYSTALNVSAFQALVHLPRRPTNPATVRLYGWRGNRVYLHYLPPHSRRASSTAKLGRTTGPCGHGRARLKHMFPGHPKAGTWTLVFDIHRRYAANDPAPHFVEKVFIFKTFHFG